MGANAWMPVSTGMTVVPYSLTTALPLIRPFSMRSK
jgi:hypothetical protein